MIEVTRQTYYINGKAFIRIEFDIEGAIWLATQLDGVIDGAARDLQSQLYDVLTDEDFDDN